MTRVLIDGRPWGFGADRVDGGFKGWRCHKCGSKHGGRLFFGEIQLCAPCARIPFEDVAP